MLFTVPLSVAILFCAATLLTVYFLLRATHMHRITRVVIMLWILVQSVLAYYGFYSDIKGHPERFPIAVAPTLFLMVGLFATKQGRAFIDSLDLRWLTMLHIVRIPVEIGLFFLFTYKAIPQLMTFEGRNFDIIAGITAPIVYYLYFIKNQLSDRVLLIWNIVCLGLVINIVTHGLLSAPLPIQQFAFEQPNIAVLYFPYNLLPSFIVPVVMFSHFVAIRKLTRNVSYRTQ
jgi:hypothetical protein